MKSIAVVAVSVACAALALADPPAKSSVRLVREKTLFANWSQPDFSCQVSPDHKYLFYIRPDEDRGEERRVKLVLRELATGKDLVLPDQPVKAYAVNPSAVSHLMAGRLFTPDSKKILTLGDSPQQPNPAYQLRLYDIAAGKSTDLGVSASWMQATLDHQGSHAFVYTGYSEVDDPRLQRVDLKTLKSHESKLVGWMFHPSASLELLPVLISPVGEGKAGLYLLDTSDCESREKLEVAEDALDCLDRTDEVRWTSDGRYLYYTDYEPLNDPDSASDLISVVHIRDCKTKTQLKDIIRDGVPVGPGPTDSSMFLDISGKLVLHDVATGQVLPVGEVNVCWTDGKKMIYRVLKGANKKTDRPIYEIKLADIEVTGPASGPTTRPSSR